MYLDLVSSTRPRPLRSQHRVYRLTIFARPASNVALEYLTQAERTASL